MRGRKLGELGIIKAPKWKFLKKEELSAAETVSMTRKKYEFWETSQCRSQVSSLKK